MAPMLLERFTRAERLYHGANAAAVLFLLTTGALIWQDLDKWRFHKMNVVAQGHVWLGGGLLVLATLAFLAFRRRKVAAAAARFNPGQTLNLRLLQILLPAMVASGIVIKWGKGFGLSRSVLGVIRQGHLAVAAAVLALVIGHLAMVFLVRKNRGIFGAILTGYVDRPVAERVAPDWVAAVDGQTAI